MASSGGLSKQTILAVSTFVGHRFVRANIHALLQCLISNLLPSTFLQCVGALVMLWTAPPPARKRHSM
jgi:hypothetical protein